MTASSSMKARLKVFASGIWMPALVFCIIVAGTLLLKRNIDRYRNERILNETEITAGQVGVRLADWINIRTALVTHIARDMQVWMGRPQDEFRRMVSGFLQVYKGFQAINLVDPDWVIRVTVPNKGNEPALDKDLHNHPDPSVVPAISSALKNRSLARTDVLGLLQGEKGFAVFMPSFDRRGGLVGIVDGVFRVRPMIDRCIRDKELRRRFRFTLSEVDGRPVYSHQSGGDPPPWPFQTLLSLQIVNRPWILTFAPSPTYLARLSSQTSSALVPFGIILASLMALMTRVLKTRQRELLQSEERFHSITEDVLDYTLVGIIILDAGCRVVWANRAVAKYFGMSREEMVGQDNRRLIREKIKYLFEDPEHFSKKVLATYEDNTYEEAFECHVLPDGERKERWLEHRSRPVNTGVYTGGRIEQYYAITQRKKAEEELLHVRKMESIGVMAGGVAHDFNNILMPIQGYVEMAMTELGASSPVYGKLQNVQTAARRAGELTRQLLAFSSRQPLSFEMINLNDVIAELTGMLDRILRENIELVEDLDPGLGDIHADSGQISQVLMNLIVNARGAMEAGGRLTIETRNVTVGRDGVPGHTEVPPGKYVSVGMADTGAGMEPGVLEHIFEPFYTTKARGKGTGLGLATVFGIIRQHGGTITVDSKPGKGSTFRIYLPRSDEPADDEPKVPKGFDGQGARPEIKARVLVAEDNEMVREITVNMLQSLGCEVLSSGLPDELLSFLGRYDGPVHILVSDVVMPQMSGVELFRRVLQRLPDVKVLFISGYADCTLLGEVRASGMPFLQKPFSLEDLSASIRKLM